MTYLSILWRVELLALVALAFGAALVGLFGFVQTTWWASNSEQVLIQAPDALVLGICYAAIFGFLPVVLVGAPAYSWFKSKGQATWPVTILMGLAPGLLLLPFEPSAGLWFVVCGWVVASLTHAFSSKVLP